MLNTDRALAKAEALFKKNDESSDASDEDAPDRPRRRIVRRRAKSSPGEAEGHSPTPDEAGGDRRSAREILRLLKRKEPARDPAPEPIPEPIPEPVVRPRRRAVAQAPRVAAPAYQLEVQVFVPPFDEAETVVLVIRGKDMADAIRSTQLRVEDWISERRPGAEWRMSAIELLPDILS